MKQNLLLVLVCVATLAHLYAQGSLTPPPGSPAPTMKSLDQIEPRTPISNVPYTISTSGSYYLTGNLLLEKKDADAITISASEVSLDLCGFTLSSSAAVTSKAISVADGLSDITIKNGIIRGNTTVTTTGSAPNLTWTTNLAGFSYGIYADSSVSRNFSISHLQIQGCRNDGLRCYYCNVADCTASSNGGSGIGCGYASVVNSNATSNTLGGISSSFSSVINSTATSNASTGITDNDGSVTNSTSSNNGAYGINVTNGTVTGSIATANHDAGIYGASGIVTNSSVLFNGGDGIHAPSGTVGGCSAAANGGIGIYAYHGSVNNSTATSNKHSGIYSLAGSVTNSVARVNNTLAGGTSVDLDATSSVIAFCSYGTGTTTGSTLTGNQTP
jgi:hypothetical protein